MTKTTLTICLLVILGAAHTVHAGVPGKINFQGILTDAVGDPVADGMYSVDFTIYDLAVGGTSFWTETQNVTTASGYFTVILGSVNPISDTVFNQSTRYLGVAVDGDPEMTPRTALVSVPYAQRIATIDGSSGGEVTGDVGVTSSSIGNAFSVTQNGAGRGGYFQIASGGNTEAAVQGTHVGAGPGGSFFSDGGGPGLTASATGGTAAEMYGALKTYGDEYVFSGVDTAVHVDASASQISTFGADGLEQIRLWGTSYGELLLHDGTGNDITAKLSASSNSGGALTLADETGATQIYMDGGTSGDASVQLPQNAINKSEVLDEPGLASVIQGVSGVSLPFDATDTIVIRTITVPTAGYVLAMAQSQVYILHTSGTPTSGQIGIVSPTGTISSGPNVVPTIPAGAPNGAYVLPASVMGVFAVTAGAHQFTVQGESYKDFNISGCVAYKTQLNLLFVPTLYGTVNPNTAAAISDQGPSAEEESAMAKEFNQQRMQDELTSIQAQLTVLQARLQQADAENGTATTEQ